MKWKFRILHTTYQMKTPDGVVTLREFTATIGEQFGVYMDDRLIGTISQKLTLHIYDLVFDNFVLMVFDPQDVPLVASLTVMMGSFRDNEKSA